MEAFTEIAKMNIAAGRYWLEQLSRLQVVDFDHIFEEIPDSVISDAARLFAVQMLKVNKNRL